MPGLERPWPPGLSQEEGKFIRKWKRKCPLATVFMLDICLVQNVDRLPRTKAGIFKCRALEVCMRDAVPAGLGNGATSSSAA